MQEEVLLIKKMQKNDRAIRDNIAQMRKLYANQYIAVDDGKVLLNNPTLDGLKKKLKEKKIDLMNVLIQYIPKKGLKVLYLHI